MARKSGKELEQAFGEWMRENLGFRRVEYRELVKGKTADRPYEVDVHGAKFDPAWGVAWVIAVVSVVVAAAAFVLPGKFPEVQKIAESLAAWISPKLAGSGLVVLAFAASLVGYIARKQTTIHAWVECKDLKTSVKRAAVQKTESSVADVRQFDRKKWVPHVVMIVSGGAFDQDALSIASEKGIECYVRTEQGFKRCDK